MQNSLKQEAQVEISTLSGMLHVTVHPKTHWLLMLVEVAIIVILDVSLFREWAAISLLFRGLLLWGTIAAVIAWFYQLSGSEVIEIDPQYLSLHKSVLGWDRTSKYRIGDCRELEYREQGENDRFGLQCKVGWKTIRFGEYISEDKAIEILTLLQREFPDIAEKLLATPDSSKKHFMVLGLS